MLTKKILLAGIAAGALTAAAGSAGAITLSAVIPVTAPAAGSVTVTNAASTYQVASTATYSATAFTLPAATTVTAALTTGSYLSTAGTYLITYTFNGASGFGATPTVTSNAGANCAVTYTLSSGGGTTSNNVGYIVTVPNGCTAAPGVTAGPTTFTLTGGVGGFIKTASVTAVSATVALNIGSATGAPVDNSPSTALPLVTPVTPFTVVASNSVAGVVAAAKAATATPNNVAAGTTPDLPTSLALGATPGSANYTTFITNTQNSAYDQIVGYAGVFPGAPGNIYTDLTGASVVSNGGALSFTDAISANGSSLTGLTFTLNALTVGNSITSTASCSGTVASTLVTNGVVTASPTPIAIPAGGAAYCVAVSTTAGNTTSLNGGNYNQTVTPSVTAGAFTPPAAVTAALEPILLAGTNIIAPWVGDGSNNYQAVVRLGNITNAALPAGVAVLLNPVNPNSTATCPIPSIPANSSITISSAQLNACFGSFGNSDVRFTLPAQYTSVSAKLRIINASTGVVTEQSIGTGQNLTFGNGQQ